MRAERSASDLPDDIAIEPAAPDDRIDALRVLDAAMLETDVETVDAAIDAGDALVARFKRTNAVVGALVATRPDPTRLHVDAVAVRRARRGRGIGSALVARAMRRGETDPEIAVVTAEFKRDLEDFYTDLGFAIGGGVGSEASDDVDGEVGGGDIDAVETERLHGRYPVDGGGADAVGTGERRR
ncbi:GCN5-related N-acetyltransferase [Halorubrum aidingense JCM 13560]|uniref:GCN5-related N-acetyltransferase n=1 Tax=Halorubrum aidingense JCM 13560 TaxID=1230454 RepID=M0PJI9_9EURY|nr:GNAT family N-acetyltransferase [Halorubrum aidingense]EMA70241.1 GCN5-related N-acetyltransferase [Halorubrum aidingense JCM 13560]